MANLTDTASAWEAGIYQIETTDPVVGGAPNPSTGAGMSNIPHLQLAKRTVWLKSQVEALQNGGGYKSALTFTGNQTLTAADAGKCYIYGETTAVTLTLPTIAATPDGSIFEFVNTGTANMTVQRAGSDQIDNSPSAVSSIVIPPNQSLKLIRATGSSLWHAVSLSAAGLAALFASSLAANGWQRLPSGLILQWVRNIVATTNSNGDATIGVIYPIAFPNAVFGSSFMPVNEASFSPAGISAQGNAVSLSSMTITIRGGGASQAVGISGISIGL